MPDPLDKIRALGRKALEASKAGLERVPGTPEYRGPAATARRKADEEREAEEDRRLRAMSARQAAADYDSRHPASPPPRRADPSPAELMFYQMTDAERAAWRADEAKIQRKGESGIRDFVWYGEQGRGDSASGGLGPFLGHEVPYGLTAERETDREEGTGAYDPAFRRAIKDAASRESAWDPRNGEVPSWLKAEMEPEPVSLAEAAVRSKHLREQQ